MLVASQLRAAEPAGPAQAESPANKPSNAAGKPPFMLETLVDFPDDATTCPFALTPKHLDAMMTTLAAAGVGRVIWADYGDGHGGYLMPSGIRGGSGGDSGLAFDQSQWAAYAATLDALGSPLRAATEAAHRHGLELYAYYKPYETGVYPCFAEGSPQARQWGRLPCLGGYLTWMDPFVLAHPHLRIQRRSDDLRPDAKSATVASIRLTKSDDKPTRISKDHLQIWTSDLNYRYEKAPLEFRFQETVEPSPREVRDVGGKLVTAKGAPVRVLTLSGLSLDARYLLVTTDFTSGPADFTNAGDRILTALDAQGKEIPASFATGTAICFAEWEDFRRGGLGFDTGRAAKLVTLDLPNGGPKVQGCVAMTRGRNRYLPGALCETEPEVQAFWLSRLREMLAAGVDGIEIRVENHSTHTDVPEDYGFNPAVLARLPKGKAPQLADMARVRGAAYTEFLRQAKAVTAQAGKRLRINLNVDWFRPAGERPVSRRLAFPANIDFEWRTWVEEGLLDAAMLRPFEKPFAGIFGEDAVAQEMIAACQRRNIPVSVNRYVWANPRLLDEFRRVLADGRFASFVLYETWSYLSFTPDGKCRFDRSERPSWNKDAADMFRYHAETGARVQDLCGLWQEQRKTLRNEK